MRIECPHCETSYTAERCGLALTGTEKAKATIACGLCKEVFDVVVMPREVTKEQPLGWFAKYILRQKPEVVTVQDGHQVESFKPTPQPVVESAETE